MNHWISAQKFVRKHIVEQLLDLNLKFKEIGLELGAALKSSRSDAKISDWDGDNSDKSHYVDKREKDHDVMAKIYGKYASPVFYGLKNETDFTYYVDNFWQIRSRDSKESSEIKDSGRYAEYIEEDGTKQALGNMVLNTKLSGKVLDKVDLIANLNYKANQKYRWDYIKLKSFCRVKATISKRKDVLQNGRRDLQIIFPIEG